MLVMHICLGYAAIGIIDIDVLPLFFGACVVNIGEGFTVVEGPFAYGGNALGDGKLGCAPVLYPRYLVAALSSFVLEYSKQDFGFIIVYRIILRKYDVENLIIFDTYSLRSKWIFAFKRGLFPFLLIFIAFHCFFVPA